MHNTPITLSPIKQRWDENVPHTSPQEAYQFGVEATRRGSGLLGEIFDYNEWHIVKQLGANLQLTAMNHNKLQAIENKLGEIEGKLDKLA